MTSSKLRGYKSYGAFSNFQAKIKGYKVAEVTWVAQGFRWRFSMTSSELRGYESYGAFTNFQTKIQGCKVAEVTWVAQGFWLRFSMTSSKLRGFESYGAFTNFTNFWWHRPSYEVTEVTALFKKIENQISWKLRDDTKICYQLLES